MLDEKQPRKLSVNANEITAEEQRCAHNDLLRNAQTSMMSWAEKNFRQKLIDNLYHMRYYKSNQTIYLNENKNNIKEST